MTRLLARSALVKLCCVVSLVFVCGCEDDPRDGGVSDYFDNNPYTSDSRPSTATLVISPSSATLDRNGRTTTFTASGGRTPYVWSVNDVSRGSIVQTGSSSVVYQRNAAGDNSVILQDAAGSRVFATVQQP